MSFGRIGFIWRSRSRCFGKFRGRGAGLGRGGSFRLMARHSRSPRHRHSRESGNPEHFRQWHGSLCWRVLDSRFRGNDGGRPTGMPPVWPGPPLGMMGGGAIPPSKPPDCPLDSRFRGNDGGRPTGMPPVWPGQTPGMTGDGDIPPGKSPICPLDSRFRGNDGGGGPGAGAAWIPAFAGMTVGAAPARGRRGFPLSRE